MTDVRITINDLEEEKLEYVQNFLKIKKKTDVLRKLLDDKYEELIKLNIARKAEVSS